jgi:hypothetical protein
VPRTLTMSRISEFATTLDGLDARWRKTPPVRVKWYKPPLRRTPADPSYAVSPAKTMFLKVMILTADSEGPALISVALFKSTGRFMFDTKV